MDFQSSKSKKSLVFAELIAEFPDEEYVAIEEDSFPNEHIFFISTSKPWYGDILIYLLDLKYPATFSREERHKLRVYAQNYLIIGDTLYRRGVDSVLRRCLTHEEVETILNDAHSGACGGHLSGLATAQKILCASYFWPTIFKDCVEAVKHCHPCQLYTRKMRSHPAPIFPFISVGPFMKWGIDYVTCKPVSAGGHKHIIVVVDYFMKWEEEIPTFKVDGETTAFFVFNQIIA